MANAGMPSQKALACDIAQREGLSNPPTAMVSKVFNEERVDAVQLARVALALGVPVQSIYHDQQDSHSDPAEDTSSGDAVEAHDEAAAVSASTPPTVQPTVQRSTNRSRPALLAMAATGVLMVSVALWYFSSRPDGTPAISAVPADAMRDFRQAQSFLDSSPSELNLRRAQSDLEAALRRAPAFVAAAAQLCETLVRQSWAHDEAGALHDARTVCDRARAMDQDAAVTRTAYAHLLLRTGRAAESALMLEELLVKEPHDRDALLLASEARIDQFLKTGERQFALKAQRHARLGIEAAPRFWKAHWQLGRAEFELGRLDRALRSYKEAARLDPNEYVLGNLGSVSFCSGDVQGAHDAYQQARRVTGNQHLGEEYMGMFYYYLGAFPQSLEARQRAVASFNSETGPEIHQIWGDLGDSYRRVGQPTAAVDAYTRAIQIVDQDMAIGNATTGDRAYRAYYRIASGVSGASMLDGLRPDLEQLTDVTEPGALVRVAIAWRMLGANDKSQEAAKRAGARCPVYRNHPDLRTGAGPALLTNDPPELLQ